MKSALAVAAAVLAGCGTAPGLEVCDSGACLCPVVDAGACEPLELRDALSGTRLRTRYLVGEDGSRAPLGFQDTARGEPCDFVTAEDGRHRCLPSEDAAFFGNFYFDAACSERIAFSHTCTTARYALENSMTCPTRRVMYAVTALPTDGGSVFFTGPSPCSGGISRPSQFGVFYRVTGKVTATEFVGATLMTE